MSGTGLCVQTVASGHVCFTTSGAASCFTKLQLMIRFLLVLFILLNSPSKYPHEKGWNIFGHLCLKSIMKLMQIHFQINSRTKK